MGSAVVDTYPPPTDMRADTDGAQDPLGIEVARDPLGIVDGVPLTGKTMRGLLHDDPFEATFEAAGVGLAIVDLTGRYVRVNESYARLHAMPAEDMIGEPLHHDADRLNGMLVDLERGASNRDEYEIREGTWASIGLRLRTDSEGAASWFVVDAEDVTRRRRAEQELEHRTMHDDLTGLANRVLVLDRLTVALARSARGAGDVGVVFCDLDGFKDVNDRHGHLLGDLVLREVATRLRGAVRPCDTVGRLGGDEFVVVVEPPVSDGDLRQLAERLSEAVTAPLRYQGSDTRVGVSIGSARSSGPELSAERLIARADSEMYAAKRGRRRG